MKVFPTETLGTAIQSLAY